MSLTVDFPAPLRDWIALNLTRGVQPDHLKRDLASRNSSMELSSAMVDAVAAAFLYGVPMPGDTLDLGAPAIAFEPDALRVPVGPSIQLAERKTRVIARLQRPAAVLLDEFLTGSECDQLIALARPRLSRSTVVDPVTGRDVAAGHRSSDGTFFRLAETPLVARLEMRIAALTGLAAENGEGLQLLRYQPGAESTPHVDYLVAGNETNRESIARSGQRVGTLLMYLNDVEGGGETVFPQVGCSVVPRRGQALYFEYCNRAGVCDPASLHASTPLRSGEKWVATKWIRARRFVPGGNGR
ncbi:proCollegen-proline,2-oxoglutarate-4- dioxygenase (plasmid) [Burkholderia sp. YI23]|nr:proCollegen-proline,2-oxoglutarate-4- dioxygenase [Burkholderia sp. YI23]